MGRGLKSETVLRPGKGMWTDKQSENITFLVLRKRAVIMDGINSSQVENTDGETIAFHSTSYTMINMSE